MIPELERAWEEINEKNYCLHCAGQVMVECLAHEYVDSDEPMKMAIELMNNNPKCECGD